MKTVPTEVEWENYSEDMDANYAYGVFFGKTNEDMQKAFQDNVLERVSDLSWMPKIPFQYYIFGLMNYVMKQEWGFYDSSDAASCFLDLILEKLHKQPDFIKPILDELMPAIQFVSMNQEQYEADEDIYGNFHDKYNEITSFRNINT